MDIMEIALSEVLKYFLAYPFGLIGAYFIMMILALPILVITSMIGESAQTYDIDDTETDVGPEEETGAELIDTGRKDAPPP